MPYKGLIFSALLGCIAATAPAYAEVRTVEWTDLMPEEDLQLLLDMPAVDHAELTDEELAADGPVEPLRRSDNPLANEVENAIGQAMGSNNQAAEQRTWEDVLVSTEVRPELDKTRIRLPGFIVPLEFDDDMNISEFFLVPYFGACIHMPPPPPNQIIFVSYPQGLQLDELYTPFWVSGELKIETVENDTALAVYSMDASEIIEYQEP